MTLRLPDSGADISIDGRRHAPSAMRNQDAILDVLRAVAPAKGSLLEIASGSGQHAAAGARALPGLIWQPSDANPDNLTSIAAWAAHDPQPNLRPAVVLDAATPGWAKDWPAQDVVLIINLMHLIPGGIAAAIIANAARALAPKGKLMVYGPFLRDGQTTSDGDAAFDASLRAQDPTIGYKDLAWLQAQFTTANLATRITDMPANNLMLIGTAP
jgi:SAM-dependent methyltransferase